MKSLDKFIIKPIGANYNDKSTEGIVLESSIDNHQHVNRIGEIISTPYGYNGELKEGDEIIVHHNVFRLFRRLNKMVQHNNSFFKDNQHEVNSDVIFAYKRNGKWIATNGNIFVSPIENLEKDGINITKFIPIKGRVEIIGKNQLNKLKVGDVIYFAPDSEYEFIIDDKLYYKMSESSIVIKTE